MEIEKKEGGIKDLIVRVFRTSQAEKEENTRTMNFIDGVHARAFAERVGRDRRDIEKETRYSINENLAHLSEEVCLTLTTPKTIHFTRDKYLARKPDEAETEHGDYTLTYSGNHILKEMQGKNYYCGPISILAMMGQEPLVNMVQVEKALNEERINAHLETDGNGIKRGMTALDFAGLAKEVIPEGKYSPDYKRVNVQIWTFADLGNILNLYALESLHRGGKTISEMDLPKDCVDLVKKGVRIENAMLDIGDIVYLIRGGYNVAINYGDHYVVAYGVGIRHYEDGMKYADLRFVDPETGENTESTNTIKLREHLANGLPVEGAAVRIQLLDR